MTTKSRVVKLASKDLSLEDGALALLRAVDSSVRVFTSDGETPEALADFEQSIRLLRMMEDRRYIEAISSSINVVPGGGGGSRVDRVRLCSCTSRSCRKSGRGGCGRRACRCAARRKTCTSGCRRTPFFYPVLKTLQKELV